MESPIYNLLNKLKNLPRHVSHIYNFLIERNSNINTGLKKVWESELNKKFTEQQWGIIVKQMLKPMRDACSKLIQFKILNRLYWTPVKLFRAKISNSDACWRCKQSPGNLLHMFIMCPILTSYWQKVMGKINSILNSNLPLTPTLGLLNFLDYKVQIETEKIKWLKIALTTARRVRLY